MFILHGRAAEFNRLQCSVSRKLIEWKNDQLSANFESLHPEDQTMRRITKMLMRVLLHHLQGTPEGTAPSESEKGEALAESLETVSAEDRSFGLGSN
jgi:hypothetical protein